MIATAVAFGRMPAVCLLVLLTMAAAPRARADASSTSLVPPSLTVAEDANGSTVRLRRGQTLVVRLRANATTGYQWNVTGGVGDRLTLISKTYEQDKSTALGRGGTAVFVFRADAAGTTRLMLGYSRPWERQARPARIYSLQVQAAG